VSSFDATVYSRFPIISRPHRTRKRRHRRSPVIVDDDNTTFVPAERAQVIVVFRRATLSADGGPVPRVFTFWFSRRYFSDFPRSCARCPKPHRKHLSTYRVEFFREYPVRFRFFWLPSSYARRPVRTIVTGYVLNASVCVVFEWKHLADRIPPPVSRVHTFCFSRLPRINRRQGKSQTLARRLVRGSLPCRTLLNETICSFVLHRNMC